LRKILITGANGFFASRFYEYYKNKYDIIPLTKKQLDVTNEKNTVEIIKECNPDIVIHTAAMTATKDCEDNPSISEYVNITGSKNVAKGCSVIGAKMIFLSTEQVYNGNKNPGPYYEEDCPNPNTQYGKTKLEAETEIKKIIDNVWILRLTWLFGFPERFGKINSNIIWNVMIALLKNERVKFPLNEYRGMTYVYDLITAINKTFDIPYGTYNTGSENNLSTYDIACIVLKEMGLENRIGDLIIKDKERYREHNRDLRMKNTKLKKCGIEFATTEEGIKKCIKEFDYKL